MTLKAGQSMIFDNCKEREISKEIKEKYKDKYRWECRVCSNKDKELLFHVIDSDPKSIRFIMAMCEQCHDLFCDDLDIDNVVTSENDLVKKIQEYQKVSQSILLTKMHGNNYQETGLPDFIGHVKGQYLGLETKCYDNNPTMIQAHKIREIRETGGLSYTCYSIEQFYTIINSIREDYNDRGS